jgi:hypothetical protein
MWRMKPAFVVEKVDLKQSGRFALALALIACSLFFEGCAGVPQSAAAAPQSSTQQMSLSSSLPGSTVGSSYHTVLSVSGGSAPYRFVVSQGQLPPGLVLNPQTGSISGVPSQVGTFVFTITVTGNLLVTPERFGPVGDPVAGDPASDSAARTYTVTIAAASSVNVQISPADPSVAAGGKVQFAATVTNTSNTAVNWSSSAGSISASGLFTAPVSGGVKSVTVTATSAANSSAHVSATATITSILAAFTISTKSVPPAAESTAYSTSLATTGGQPPYQWTIVSGTLPAGLQLNPSTGLLSGSATQTGTFTFNVQSTDAASQTAQQSYSMTVSGSGPLCGPPTYSCSRTDQATVQLPSLLPNVGNLKGANTIITDPNFGNRIVRITDANTNPSSIYINRSYMTADSGSADENLWNLDSTLFVVQDTGSQGYPYTFNPITMQAARMYVSSLPATNGLKLNNGGVWSHVNSNLLYTHVGTAINKYDFTDRTNPPSAQPVYDFTSGPNCLPAGFPETWSTNGGVSYDDTVFGMGYSNKGGQGTGVYVVAYKVGSGCSILNTQTGQVTGDWGEKGTIDITDRWLVHNVKISKDGNWLVVATSGCLSSTCLHGPYFWQIGTTNVYDCGEGGLCDGHWTEGYTHWVNNNDTPFSNQVIRIFSEPASAANITHSFPAGLTGNLDEHQSWNNVDPQDTLPFASTTYSPNSPFPSAWYNEIIAVSADGSGTTWRFSHSYITAANQWFSIKYGIGSISQDGRFFIFSSDWMGKLGSESGTANCIIGTNCRGDVFVVELR